MFQDGVYSTAAEREPLRGQDSLPTTTTKRKRIKNKRRFSDQQIRSLESIFESESKLEPRKKIQLAKELGLQPRQIAIWFQNRRARWKSKQLERDYSILRASYDGLASRFESLNKEKHSLLLQLQKLTNLLEKPQEASRCCGSDVAGNSTDGDSEIGVGKIEAEVKKPVQYMEGSDYKMSMCSDDENSNINGYFGQEEETELLNMVEPADGSLTTPERWFSYDSCGQFDQSCSDSQWWDFWT